MSNPLGSHPSKESRSKQSEAMKRYWEKHPERRSRIRAEGGVMDHTKEPWRSRKAHGVGCVSAGEKDIAICPKPDDARRIVACVNACSGIPTKALETPSTESEGWKAVYSENASLRSALAEMEEVVDHERMESKARLEDYRREHDEVVRFSSSLAEKTAEVERLREVIRYSVDVETRIINERILGGVEAWLKYENKLGATRDQLECARDYRQKIEALAAAAPNPCPSCAESVDN